MTQKMRDQEMMRQGRLEGIMSVLKKMVLGGRMTVDEAAKDADMTPEEFKKALEL